MERTRPLHAPLDQMERRDASSELQIHVGRLGEKLRRAEKIIMMRQSHGFVRAASTYHVHSKPFPRTHRSIRADLLFGRIPQGELKGAGAAVRLTRQLCAD